MKKKILTKHILMALAMAAMVPAGQAWAAWQISEDGQTITFEEGIKTVGNSVVSSSYDGEKPLNEFENIIINATDTHGMDLMTNRVDFPISNITVTVNGNTKNTDGARIYNNIPHLIVNDYTAYIHAPISDALNIDHGSTSNNGEGVPYIHILGNLKAEVDQGHGIRANAPVKYITNTENSYATTITVDGSSKITINGDASNELKTPTAVWAGDAASSYKFLFWHFGAPTLGKGEVYLKGDTDIILNGNGNRGIWAGRNGNIFANNIKITSEKDKSYGIAATNENITYENSMDDSENRFGSTVTLSGDITIDMGVENKESRAIYASSQYGIVQSGDLYEDKDGDIYGEVKPDDLKEIGTISITGDIEAENGGLIALHATGDDSVQSFLQGDIKAYGTENDSGATVNLSVDHALAGMGTIAAANGGTVTLSLGEGSNWSGRADDYQDAVNEEWNVTHNSETFENPFSGNITSNGTVNMTLSDGAIWNVTGQSWVTNLAGANSTIILCGDTLHEGDGIVSVGTGGYALHVENLTGTNTFIMNVRPNETGDMLYIKNGNSHAQNLIINNRDEVLANMDVNDAVRFATVTNPGHGFAEDGVSDGSTAATFGTKTRISDAGMFNVDFNIKYNNYGEELADGLTDLGSEGGDADDAYNGGDATADKPSSDYVDHVYNENGSAANTQNVYLVRVGNTMNNVTDAGKTVIDMSKVNYSNAVYMDRLNKRMGEARYIEGDDGLWVRLRHDRIGREDAFRSMNTMFELGYDRKVQDQKDGEHRRGVAFDYMRGEADYTNVMGSGDVRRAGVWLYDTWFGDKGHYSDYVLKYGRLSNDFDIFAPTTGDKISGDYDNDVWSASAEYGRKKDIGNDWYFEPQAQLQYAYVTSADYTTSQNTKVSLDGIDSLIGRAGFRLGRDTSEGNTVYFKADILHEFLGDQSIRAMDGTGVLSTTYDNEGTWYDVGFGFSHRMGEDSYMFLDVEHSFGNDNEDTYQINIGLNRAF